MTATWKAGWPMPVATGSGSQSVAPSGPLADSEWQWPGLSSFQVAGRRPGLASQASRLGEWFEWKNEIEKYTPRSFNKQKS